MPWRRDATLRVRACVLVCLSSEFSEAMALQVLSSGLGSVKKAAPEASGLAMVLFGPQGRWYERDPRNRVTQRETPLEKNLREA